jgi:hypothetical protein
VPQGPLARRYRLPLEEQLGSAMQLPTVVQCDTIDDLIQPCAGILRRIELVDRYYEGVLDHVDSIVP